MTLPGFPAKEILTATELRTRIVDRVRRERRRLGASQEDFAKITGIALRTYKRFELDQCDSLNVFIRIVITFDRVVAFDLLFPPEKAVVELRTPLAALERLRNRMVGRKEEVLQSKKGGAEEIDQFLRGVVK